MTPGGLVLVTRPQPAAAATAARLHALGLNSLIAPLLQVRPVGAILPPSASLQAVLVTSANALASLSPAYHTLPLLAVGAATAAAARAQRFAIVHSAEGDAAALCRLATRLCNPAGAPLLLASGRGQGRALAATLIKAGFRVHHATVYATKAAPILPPDLLAAWEARSITTALFFSAATARVMVRRIVAAGIATGAAAIEALAIAPAAAAALAPLPWLRVRVAVTPDQDAMLALLT